MDTTKEYILMCEKAEEIQLLKDFQCGDFYYDGKGWGMDDGNEYPADKEDVWLPRQDQLQEILKTELKLYSDNGFIGLLNIFIDNVLVKKLTLQTLRKMSMEQLWLAFVMSKLYQKQWDGKDWVKERKEMK